MQLQQQQPKRMKIDEEEVMEGDEEEIGAHHLSSPLSVDFSQEALLGASGADVPAAAALAPTSISTAAPANSSSTSVLLSMMHSMPFLVFGPQLAAAAAAAAALASSNHHHHHHQMNPASAQQNNHNRTAPKRRYSPNNSSSTDFSIDSILNDHRSSTRISPQSSSSLAVQLAPKVSGSSTQFSAWSTSALGNGHYQQQQQQHSYDSPSVHQVHHHLCDHPSAFSWLSSPQQQPNSHNLQYNITSSAITSPSKIHHHHSPCTTTSAETADHHHHHQVSKCSPKSTDSSSHSSTSNSSTAPNIGSTSSKQQRKTLNRGPRIPFTSSQVAELEAKFAATQYLSSMEVSTLAKRLSLTDNRIRIWFQNRRAREKREHRPSVAATSRTSDENGGDQCKEEMTMTNSVTSDAESSYNNADIGGQEELERHEGDDH